jgi:hypothetical protein
MPQPDPPPLFPSNFRRLTDHSDWRTTWTHIVSGKFSSSPYDGLLFYDRNSGYAEFYETDGYGGITFLQNDSNWRKSWTHIISGAFYGPDRTGLLFYDRQAGFAAIYNTDGAGNLDASPREHSGWRTSWTHITTVRIPDPNTDGGVLFGILLYDQAAGRGEIHKCDGAGNLELIVQSDGWRTSWTQVVGDFFSGTGVLFYEASTSHGEVYAVTYDSDAETFGFEQQAIQEGLAPATDIVAGNFGWYETTFLFYDRPSGRGTFVFYTPVAPGTPGTLGIVPDNTPETYDDWRTTWHLIVPGNFWEPDPEYVKFQDGFSDLLFYDRPHGYGEFYSHEPYDSIYARDLEGYVSSGSVAQGENIGFHVNSRVGAYTITVYREDLTEVLMTAIPNIQQFQQPFPIGRLDYRDGPTWPTVAELNIPTEWPSGLYIARVAAISNAANTLDIPFVVRASNPGSQSTTLLFISDTTYNAYNFWGGRSLYGFRSQGVGVWSYGSNFGSASSPPDSHQFPRAFRVAFARPYSDEIGFPKWQQWEVPLLRWLARQGIAVEVCTATDLHKAQANHTGLLENYRLLVSVGHDEYWSKEMRDNVEAYTAAGGNVVFLSANVCWFQVRFDLDGARQICYKDARFDPYNPSHSDLVTVNWYDYPVCRAETAVTGVSYFGTSDAETVYHVLQPDHWAFAGLDSASKVLFGLYIVDGDETPRTVVGYETDKYQSPQSNHCLPSSPSNFQCLAEVPSLVDPTSPTATMGTFTNGKGQVFTVGTMNWALGLSQGEQWNAIDQITQNIFDKLA